jgi:tetratricopeptide (TPR) repeat protein
MKYTGTIVSALIASLVLVASGWGDNEPRAGVPEKLGRVLFKTSCSPEAQVQFERALAMQHSFFFPETVKAFTAIPQIDSSCAIAYWGIAISQRPNPLVGPFDAATLKRGLDAIERGESIGPKTQRERDWLAALKEYYKAYETVDQDTRTKNYATAMEGLAKKYPDDVEAKIFWALALNETFDHKSMDPLVKAVAILEPIDKKYPDHPGVTHYLIHSYDFAPIAKRGIPAANKYAKIAPAAPHAQHMPSHIYSMVGMWEESVVSNWRSVAVANEYTTKSGLDGTLAGVPHAYDFMAYAYLQMGQDVKARSLIQDAASIKKVLGPALAGSTARAAVPARYVLERQDWAAAAQLQPLATGFPMAEAITYFTRAMGGARSGDLAAAQADIEKLKAQRAALEKANQGYWAGQVEVQIIGAQAWLAQGQGNKSDALKFMREAADLEDASEKHVAMENRLYPMRELLGDMLMAQGEARAALTEYEKSLQNAPMRLRGFYGAAKAADAAGDPQRARAYFEKLAKLTRNADGDRPELRDLKQRLASK